jgi:hypothetical protein
MTEEVTMSFRDSDSFERNPVTPEEIAQIATDFLAQRIAGYEVAQGPWKYHYRLKGLGHDNPLDEWTAYFEFTTSKYATTDQVYVMVDPLSGEARLFDSRS